MKIKFTFEDLKPVSTNAYKAPKVLRGRPIMFKTKKATDFEKQILLQMHDKGAEIFDFESNFSIYEHILSCDILIESPDLITKKDGVISSKSIDLDNNAKVLIDAVFKKFEKLDDKMICKLSMRKSLGKNNRIFFTLERKSISSVK